MRLFFLWMITLSFGFVMAEPSSAQTYPTAEEILKAWLLSPHANSKSESFRHWDTESEIPGNCAVCHSTTGIAEYLSAPRTTPGVIDHAVPIGTTIECAACHSDGAKNLSSVLFPNGQTVERPNSSAICSVCHQGRTSMDQVAASVQNIGEDEVSADLQFINIHYAAAASTQLGGTVRGGYQYQGRNYAGPFGHVANLDTCVSCHGAHDTAVELQNCTSCHQGVTDFKSIRTSPLDIFSNGKTDVGIGVVVNQLHGRLRAAIMQYAAETGGGAIVYSDATYPYFFNDLDRDGIADETETVYPNRYNTWTPRLLKAAYNYQFVGKDGGAFAHNPHYVIQLMIDSIQNLAEVTKIDVSALVRP